MEVVTWLELLNISRATPNLDIPIKVFEVHVMAGNGELRKLFGLFDRRQRRR